MGTGSFTNQNDGEVAEAAAVQQVIDSLKGDLVPRNASGVATANAGEVGTETYPMKKANVTTGYLFAGLILPMHTYNGLLTPGQGWYPCDGTIINETNYDAIHGAGSWDEFIVSSLLDGKYTANLSAKYLTGASTTSQTGVGAFTYVGNASNNNNAPTHTHSSPVHNHTFTSNTGTGNFIVWSSAGTQLNINGEFANPGGGNYGISVVNTGNRLASNFSAVYTSNNSSSNTGSGGGLSMSIRPHSFEVIYYIRIV